MCTILKSINMCPRLMALAVFAFAGAAALAQSDIRNDPVLRRELRYIELLNEARMPDFAELVLKDVERKFPGAGSIIKVLKLEQVLQVGKFDEAKAILAQEANQDAPDALAMRLTIADYYYAYGKYDEALAIYQNFFAKHKDFNETIAEFYLNSYYKFAQMLLQLGRDKDALEAYEAMLKLKFPDDMLRQIKFEAAQLMVKQAEKMDEKDRKALLPKAKKLVEDVMWIPDLWFGRGVVLLAQIEVLNNNIEAAEKLVQNYRPTLENIEQALNDEAAKTGEDYSRLSPMAECRFLVGSMMMDQAKKELDVAGGDMKKAGNLLSKALTEFVNVYARYPGSTWAPDALNKSEEIQTILRDTFNVKEINIKVTDAQKREIASKQFANARMLFNMQQFAEAESVYLTVLNQFPYSVPDSVIAMSELARVYIQLADNKTEEERDYYNLCAETVAGELAERFAKRNFAEKTHEAMTLAGEELIRIAEFYGERNQNIEREQVYARFFVLYPDHNQAATRLLVFANKAFDEDNMEKAIPYYEQLMNDYQRSPLSLGAVSRLADCYNKLGDIAKEIEIREIYLERVKAQKEPGGNLVVGTYALARALRNKAVADLRAANATFDELKTSVGANTGTDDEAEAETAAKLKEAEAAIAAANKQLATSVNTFGQVIKILEGPDASKYHKDFAQEQVNKRILESAYFDRAFGLSALTQPAARLTTFKQQAISTYEALIKAFPQSDTVPLALMQIGTIWSTLKTDNPEELAANMKKADEAFAKLANDYPDSEQAKNVYFLRGRTLIELGYRRDGVEVLKKMFDDPTKYSAGQILLAAEELLKSKEFALADRGFDIALKQADKNEAIIVPATLGKAHVLVEDKKYTEAVDTITQFLKAYPKSYKIIEANELLSRAAREAGVQEKDRNARMKLFSTSVSALKTVSAHKTSSRDKAKIEIEIGKLFEAKYASDEKFDTPANAEKSLREASSHYQAFIAASDARDAEIAPYLEEAYSRNLPLMLKLKLFEFVLDDSIKYEQDFPKGRYAAQIQSYKTEAEIGLTNK